MAITIHTAPQAYTPSDNDVLWSFSSDQTSQPNFEYKIELNINNVLQYTAKIFPIQGAVAYFNATEVLRGLIPATNINSQPNVSLNDLDELFFGNSSFRLVNITITERWGDPPSDQTGAVSTVQIGVWKSALSELQWLTFQNSDHVLNNVNTLFLTNFPRQQKYWIDPSKNNYLSFINNTAATSIFLRWNTDDDNGNYEFGTFSDGVYFFNGNLAKITIGDGTDFDKFVTFQVQDATSPFAPRSEAFRFKLYNGCITDRTIYFLNKLGGIDSWIFSARKQVNRDFERATFKKKFGTLQGNNYVYDSFQGREQNYHNSSTETVTVDSDWLHPDVHAWLVRELLESPLVWMEDHNGIKTRYIVVNARSEEGQDQYDVWRQLSLEIKPTLQSYSATL